jgi:protein MpaA
MCSTTPSGIRSRGSRIRAWATLVLTVWIVSCAAEPIQGERVDLANTPDVRESGAWVEIGRSVQGRSLQGAVFGTGAKRIYLIASIHGDERSGGENVDRLRTFLLDEVDLTGLSVRLLRDANPDGSETHSRQNARGVDLNRNWPSRSFRPGSGRGPAPLSEPESAAVYSDMIAFDPHLVVVLHAARGGPFVNYDGPAEREAGRFARGAARIDSRWHVRADMGYPTPGSLGSLIGIDMGVPILTIEFKRDSPSDAVWPTFRAGLTALPGGEDEVFRVR